MPGSSLLSHQYLFTVDQAHQALTAADVVADVAVGQPVDHVAVVHHVSGEQQLVLTIVEADAATRVTGHVEHSQLSVPQVDDVALTIRKQETTFDEPRSLTICLATILRTINVMRGRTWRWEEL